MKLNADVREIPLKKVLLTLTVLLAVVGLAFGGWAAYKKVTNRPLTPEESKRLIANYLEEKSGASDCKSSIDISKEKNPWQALKFVYDSPPDYKTVYRAIGEHLSVAEELLGRSEPRAQQNGLRIVAELLAVANEVACDAWLGARIADGYIVPNFDKAADNARQGMDGEQLMHWAGRAYHNAEEGNKLIDLGKLYLTKFGSSPRADDVRRRLANMLQNQGRKKEAQVYLSQIKNSSSDPKSRRNGQSAEAKPN